MILLDTHVIIWFAQGDALLGSQARAMIENERARDIAMVAPITVWEAAMLAEKGKLILGQPVDRWFEAVLAAPGFRLAELTVAIGADAGSLRGIHGDPGDRLIIATARALGCPLLTADRAILDYAAAGHLRAIDARR